LSVTFCNSFAFNDVGVEKLFGFSMVKENKSPIVRTITASTETVY